MNNRIFALPIAIFAVFLLGALLVVFSGISTPVQEMTPEATIEFLVLNDIPVPPILTFETEKEKYTCTTYTECRCMGAYSCCYCTECDNGRHTGCVEVNPLLCGECL